jgi:CheY-like chemotaxis protein
MLDFITQRELPAVLLIDDDMVSREVMATILTMSGYPVHTAVSGEAALELLSEQDFAPNIVLLDAQLPGLHGAELIAQIRPKTRARVFAISASRPGDDMLAAADGFLMRRCRHSWISRPAARPRPSRTKSSIPGRSW